MKRADSSTRADVVAEAMRKEAIDEVLGALPCDPVIFKGTALAYSVYSRPEQRSRCDTDLFLPPNADVGPAMENLGYSRIVATSGKWIRHQVSYRKVDALGFTQIFDFHRRLSDPVLFSRLYDYESLRRDSVIVEGLGRIAGPVDAVVIACVHQIAHHPGEDDAQCLCDLDRLLDGRAAAFWRALRARAEEKGVVAIVGRALAKTASRARTRIDWTPAHRKEFSRLYLRYGKRKSFRVGADLVALPGWRARAEYVKEHLFPPAEFLLAKYGENRRARLPALYLRRLFNGWRRVFGK